MSSASRGVGRYVVVFWALVLAGLVIWALSTPAVAGSLFGDTGYEAAFGFPLYAFLGLPLLALPPLIAGFVLPKGFFVWGVALVLAYPPGAVWIYLNAGAETTFLTSEPGAGQVLSLALAELMVFLVLAFFCTAASGVGAGARYLILWRRGRLGQSPLGAG